MFKFLRTTKITAEVGPDSLSLVFLRRRTVTPIDSFTSWINISLGSASIPNFWRPVAIVPIPKSNSTIVLAKRLHPNALISSGLKLTWHVVHKRPPSSVNTDDRSHFAYKSNRFVLGTATSIIHHILKSLNAFIKSVRCTAWTIL